MILRWDGADWRAQTPNMRNVDIMNGRTVAHELGNTGGLEHQNDDPRDRNNLMMQAYFVHKFKGDYNKTTQLNHDQIKMIRDNYIHKRLHQGSPLRSNWWGKKQLR